MTNYDLIYKIDNTLSGYHFDEIRGYSCLGDVRSGADVHPIRFVAFTTKRDGDDEGYSGEGWSVREALFDLLKTLKDHPLHQVN